MPTDSCSSRFSCPDLSQRIPNRIDVTYQGVPSCTGNNGEVSCAEKKPEEETKEKAEKSKEKAEKSKEKAKKSREKAKKSREKSPKRPNEGRSR